MRNLILAAAAGGVLLTAPLAAHAARSVQGRPNATSNAPQLTVAQSQPGTVLPGVTVTAPAPPSNPWDVSTWRFHAGASRYQPRGGAGTGGYGGSGSGVVVAAPH